MFVGPRRESRKIGRNEICPCRSGKKFKKCCGLVC
nr:SEC-C metal-binding domain-containing protein [Pseudoalteromonas sp. SA25]